MKKTVLKNMMNVLTCSVLLGGALGAHQAVAALSGSTGDMVGFTATQDQYWTAPGDQVEFKLRLGGTFTATITNTFWAYPTIDVNVGGVRRKAVFKGSAQTSNDGRNYRTDLTFAYTVQAGDVAFPMMIWTNENQYVVNENSFVFFNTNGLPATWRINTGSAYGDVNFDSAFFVAANVRDENLYYRNIRLQTMLFDAGNVRNVEANGAKGYWTVNLGGVTSNAFSVVIWTPTNLVKFGETTFASAITNTVPAGSTSFTFPIKGFVEGSGARIVVQRREAFTGISSTIPSDAILDVIDVSRAGEPSARIEWLDGSSFPESDPTDNANRKRFKIVLNQTYTNLNTDIYFRIDAVQAVSGEVNVVVDPEADGYVVRAGQTESGAYGFFTQDGSLASKSSGVSLRAVATNISYYTSMPVSKVYVNNVAPTINQPNATTTFSGWRQFVTNDLGIAWSVTDVPADLATNMVFYWEMDGTLLPAQTNSVVTGNGTFKYAFTRAGMTTNKLYVVDKDGTPSLTSTFYINVEPAPRVELELDRTSYREITNSVGAVRVTLSKAFTEDVWVKVYARYGDGAEQNNTIVSDFPMMFMIPQGEMVSDPQDFTLRDGTKDSESKRITFIPEVTNTAAKAEYKDLRAKTVSVYNTAPTISVIGGNDGVTYTNVPMGSLYAFDYEIVDSQGDLAGVFTNIWSFGAGEAVVTNVSSGARGTIKYAFTSRGTKTVSVYSYDKDGGISQTYVFQVRVVQGIPLPEVIVLQPSGAVKETDAAFTYDLTVQLSQPYNGVVTVALSVLEPTNYINGIIQFQTTNVTFNAGQQTATVKFSAKDGTDYSVQHGFTVVPKVISPVAAANFYTNQVSALIFVENANPVITGPAATDIATETFAYEFTQGVQKGISWNITDVIGDKITSPASARMRVEWNFGDDSSTTTYGAAGTVLHTYTAIDDFVVTVTAFDKDGGQSGTTQFKVRVSPSKGVNVTPLGPNSASYWGVTGLGDGMVKSSEAISSTNYNNVYRFRFTSKTTAATLDAVAYKTSGTPAGYNVTNFNENGVAIVDPTRKTLNSYFFVWEGSADIFANAQNLNPATATATATIKMPASTDSTSEVDIYEVRAIFSKEFRRGDGVGDINQDGIPDGVASSIFGKIGATATTGGDTTAAMPYWLTPLRSFNDDSDFLPANPTGIGGVYDFRPVAKGSGTGNTNAVSDAINAFNAYLEVRGYDEIIGVVVNNVADDPNTDPTLADSDSDGYTDGWEYYFWYAANFGDASGNKLAGSRYNPRNISEGLVIPFSEINNAFNPMKARATWPSPYQDDFDNDGLLDIEEMLLGTNPTTWDTDNDVMCDGWEILMGLNPCDAKDGSSAMYNNIDGDYFAISSVFRQRIALVITNTTAGTVSTTTNVTTGANGSADSLTNAIYTCYYYGNATNSPLALGRKVTVDTNNVVSVTVLEDMARVLVLHFQVRDEFGFDPRTAWCDSVVGADGAVRFPLDFVTGRTPISWPTNWPGQARFGAVGTAPNTRAFTAVDEYLLLKFMRETRSDGCPDQVFAHSDLWVDYSTHPLTPDTDATPQIVDGVPDGWELYVATPKGAGTGFFAFSPWSAADRNLVVNDTLQYSRKFAGTDSVAVYTNAALYAAVGPVPAVINNVAATDVALLSGVTFPVMTGVVSITRPAVDQYWLNKFWPCDPWQSDCDNDGTPDTTTDGIDERAFIYGLPVDDGSTCIAGGGLNPCAVDTDSDGLPDGWEIQFAGTLPAIGATVAATPAITNGMDGTYVDFASDWDADGLRNVEEYLTGAIRAWRFDRGSFYSDITKRLDETYNAAYDLFVPCTNAWDKSLLDPTDKARAYWYLLPASQMRVKPAVLDDEDIKKYASASPLTADSDGDGMDDYYEVFHGLNPLLGNGYIDGSDIVAEAAGVARAISYLTNMNFMEHPFLMGMPQADPDADGLLNLEEALVVNAASSQNHHTDPSPMWATDISNPFSITRRFYRTLGGRIAGDDAASSVMWFKPWGKDAAPFFYFPFEMSEGYDTDNDGISDKDEIAGSVNTASDPLNFMSPYRRQALYFDGVQSAASTVSSYADNIISSGGQYTDADQAFKSFTVEMWICPERVNQWQTLIERNFWYDASDAGEAAVQRLRANYRIGIQPNGQLFAGFDNAGGHDAHTGVAKVLGPELNAGEWRHVALRMDATTSRLVLYVDGAEYTSQDTDLIPANGILEIYNTGGSNSFTFVSGWLTLGAKNSAPANLAISLNSNNIPDSAWAQTWGGFGNYYQGWMAEVRVWDGARTGTEIQNSYKLRFSMEDVRTARTEFEVRLAEGARRALPAPHNLPALLMNYYPMCDLFGGVDASTVAMVPRGFDSHTVTDNQPDLRVVSTNGLIVTTNMVKMGSVQWWANTEVRSMVYTNRTYLPWIQNAVSHLPGRRHVTPDGFVTFGTSGSTMDSFYWPATTMGTAAVSNSFPNTANPYGFGYRSAGGSDLLPLGSAWMRQTTNFWDKQGASASWLESAADANNDGLADWWETLNYGPTTGAGGWNAEYTGSLTEFQGRGLTNGQVYRQMLAQGWTFDGVTWSKNANYAQTADSDGDGLPDWWESLYGFDTLKTTGNDGAGGDPDGDGLSNLAEYLISEVYGFRYSNPNKFKTLADQEFSDYLIKKGKLPLGFIFTDHDFIEDAWEQNYSSTFISRFLYDANADQDHDGWSNYAESRYSSAIRAVSPEKKANIMRNGAEISEFPIPVIKTTFSYAGSRTNGNLVVQTFSNPDMNGVPDAKWSVALDTITAGLTTPIGTFAKKMVKTTLSPGSLVPGTIKLSLTDMWTGLSAQTGYDLDGKLYTMPVAGLGYEREIGTVDYATGAVTFDMAQDDGWVIILDPASYPTNRLSYVACNLSYYEFSYSAKLASQWPQELYLAQPNSGFVKEGDNYFQAFLDANGSGSWDPGEPMGVAAPFATKIGWDSNTLNIHLTDYTPNSPRISLTQMKRDVDGFLGAGSDGTGSGGGSAAGAAPSMQRVRIRRSSADMTITPTVIFDKVLVDRDYIHEGDYLAQGGYGFDWNFKGLSATFGSKYTNFVYDVYVGDGSAVDAPANVKIMSFTNILPAAHYAATPTAPLGGASVRSACPTFRWKLSKNAVTDSYAAYCIQIKKGSASGALVWNSGTIRTPLYDRASGEYYFEAPVYMGSLLQPNTLYVWSVAGLNARYTMDSIVGTTAALQWSAWKPFRMESSVVNIPGYQSITNSPVNGSDYGSIGLTVKYLGPATSLAGQIVVQAFTTRDFTGNPVAQATGSALTPARGMTTASYLASLTNQTDSTSVNAILYGLPKGAYYVRAFLDSNANGVRDAWESWGYYNYAGMSDNNIYDPRSVAVSATGITPVIMLAIEDCDTDQDFYPDAWEYEQNSGAENFLELTAPLESWDGLNDYFVMKNKLNVSGQFYNTAVLSLTLGSDDLVFNSVAADDGYSLASKVSAGLDPATSVSFAATGIALADNTATIRSLAVVAAPTTTTSARGSLLLNVMTPSQTTALQYVVQYTKSLATPQWVTVTEPCSVDASGMLNQVELSGDVDATSGFFRIVPYNP